MNIAVTTLATDNLPYQKKIFENRLEYCRAHRYAFHPFTNTFDSRPAAWSKLKIILNIFKEDNPDWVLWTDSDAVIKNKNIKIEDLIDNNFDLIISKDGFTYNTGIFLIKNTDASKKFLNECIEKEQYVGHPWEEQAAVVDFLEKNDSYKVKVVPQRILNSYPKKPPLEGWYTQVGEKKYFWQDGEGEFQEGDFVIHFAGFSPKEKELLIEKHTKNICVLSFATPDISFYAEKIFKNNKAYSKKHNYDWKEYWKSLDESRPPAWSKILYILQALEEGHEWVFWIDADAIIMNDAILLEEFIDNEYDFILCKDAFSWNTGAWFIKNSKRAKDLLKYTYSKEEHKEMFLWEQGAFMNACFEKGARVKVHQQRSFNSVARETKEFFMEGNTYECGVYKFILDMKEYDKGMYEDGDFILHYASINHAGRDMLLKEHRPDLY